MWLLRLVILAGVVAVLVTLALQNADPRVDVNLFTWEFLQVRLYAVMFAGAGLGFIAGLLFAALREIQLRMRISDERRQRARVEREVADLRAAPLQGMAELPESRPVEGGSE